MFDSKITWDSIKTDEFHTMLRGAKATLYLFMPHYYGGSVETNLSEYKKIQHIKMIRAAYNTDLMTAKQVADLTIKFYKSENPVSDFGDLPF